MKKLFLIACAVAFSAWLNVNAWSNENPTRTFYNNKIPYATFFNSHDTNQLKIQAQTRQGKVQAVIPVVNDKEKDLTQKKGN